MVSIYVLKLTKGKYYVGLTRKNVKRILQHIDKKGAAWTKKYPPLKDNEIEYMKSGLKESDENRITLEYMEKFGIKNVRGGDWYRIKMSPAKLKEVKSLISKKKSRKSTPAKKTDIPPKKKKPSKKRTNKGYCIRCSVPKSLSFEKPFCLTCYGIWVGYANQKYIEKCCHFCGKKWDTSFDKPICITCYRKNS
jgi:hypothetical protein